MRNCHKQLENNMIKPTWLTIKTNPPKAGYAIVVRSKNDFGLGHNYDVINLDSKLFNQKELEEYLASTSFVEWMPLEG
jgi:hypothetical protein